MKKLLALLMALMMCCTAFAFAEEEAEVPAVEMNVSFEAQTVALGETGLTMQIPADWAVQEVPAGTENAENILLFAVNADQTVSITAQLSAMSFETLLQGIQDAGATEVMHIAEDMLMNTGCIVPLYYYTDIYMIDDSVQGFFSNPLGYKYFMHCTIAK